MLWLALHLPLLPLEVFPSRLTPSAVICREHVVTCNAAAAAGGVVPGMRLGDAWAILPTLAVDERNVALEAVRLQALACWAGNFTPEISLAAPLSLLLEVQGSLRLFGGLERLFEQVRASCAAQGHLCHAALAPTPRAALWLARAAPGSCCPDSESLHTALVALPLAALDLPGKDESRLAGFGIRRVGELLKLPRAGLGRRFGEIPDPQPRFVFPQRFRDRVELSARVEDAERLNFAAHRLLLTMCGWLAARGCGLLHCVLELELEGRKQEAPIRVELGFSDLTRDPERIKRVLRERLGKTRLPAPVYALSLSADAPAILPGRDGSLFGERAAEESVVVLVERLQARMGAEQVFRLALMPDHRPERASQAQRQGGGLAVKTPVAPSVIPPRPCWLLSQPEALAEIKGAPHRGGALVLLAGPERIESGWWDAGEGTGEDAALGDIRRDYFVALSPRQEWLWIFRNAEGWFLHGLFA
jgi:protein ImuB